ncbi:MAG: class I SAM-dependent rRNA methyltransferase [Firmicutes bacterium]|nr:class I SAM-dependent rRNA methyltransferase [Bacillota bacterium]
MATRSPFQDRTNPSVILKRGREERIVRGHLWIYAGEIQELEGTPEMGDLVDVRSSSGRSLGRGYINLQSTIAVRLLPGNPQVLDEDFFAERFTGAARRREKFMPGDTAMRLVYGEADLLPGLIVDRYGSCIVVQILTAGMDVRRELIVRALDRVFSPAAIYERSDVPARRLEGLAPRQGALKSDPGELVLAEENGLKLWVDVKNGQKTGYFLDQKQNRAALVSLLRAHNPSKWRVLDAFCYSGGFALCAALAGAGEVLGIDSSAQAVVLAGRNSEQNGLGGQCEFREGNVFDELRDLERAGRQFECVVLDPPAFARGRATVEAALRGYKEINLRAAKLLCSPGILVTCSCSHHIDAALFSDLVTEALRDARRRARLIEARGQSSDHPVLMGMKETAYLKCLILEVF